MHDQVVPVRIAAIGMCALAMLTAACSSSGGKIATDTTQPNAAAATSTTDLDTTPNAIPFAVGEQIGLPGGWTVRVGAVHYPTSVSGLTGIKSDERYVVIDFMMQNNGVSSHAVKADQLFTLTDSLHKSHFVVKQPRVANGIDGTYAPGTKHSGKLVFTAPEHEKLGLVLAGTRIGTKLSYFAIDPPTVPPDQT